jgi:general secretion pathway protein K
LQGRFNINNLVKDDGAIDDVQVQVLQRLLDTLELDPGIAQAAVDWIDPDQEGLFPDGAEDGDYVAYDPPYRAANRYLVSVSELRLVKGVDMEAYTKLAPYLSALPEFTKINVNTVSPAVLAAVLATESRPPDLARAEALIEDRPDEGYPSVDEFFSAAQVDVASPLVKDNLDIASSYFLVDVEANVGDGRALLASVLQRDSNGASRVLVRNYGRDD